MRHKITKKLHYEMKMRGIKQDINVDYELPFKAFKLKAINFGKTLPTYVFQQLFKPSLSGGLVHNSKEFEKRMVRTTIFEKCMDVICPKAIVDDLEPLFMEVYPFGY